MAHLKGLTNLTTLCLRGSRVGDRGLASLNALTKLSYLDLSDTQVGDAGLKDLGSLTNLKPLVLANTQVGDAGLPGFKILYGQTKLRELDLTDTKVTARGVAALRQALPTCRIISNAPKPSD